ncbi:hypothetical protein ACHAWU_002565 [Discostella pseudostelligera]|uniref:Peptidase M50 domain-containing protein n=1 Tax=Discostella pseudostelligera TaxID=259834 RepID=A0ABD3LZ63_9STRA
MTKLSKQTDDNDKVTEVFVDEPTTSTTNNNSRIVRPFLSRALQKLMRKDPGDSTTTTDTDNADNSSTTATATVVTDILSSSSTDGEKNVNSSEKIIVSQADILRALAVKTRLEAEKMEVLLTLDKINKLESRLLSASSKDAAPSRVLSEEERANLVRDVQILKNKLNATSAVASAPSLINNNNNNNNNNNPKLSSNEDTTSSTQSTEPSLDDNINNNKKPILSYEKQLEAISSMDKLPQPIREMMAKSAGLPTHSNSTAIITKLAEEGRLYEGEMEGQFNMIANAEDVENADIFVDMEFAEINSFISTLLPSVTRKEPVPMEYVDAFYKEVLGKDTFQPNERNPRPVPGGYLIRGTSMVKSSKKIDNTDIKQDAADEGDLLMDSIDKKLLSSSVANKLRAYYILDPTPPSGEEILNDEDEYPVLLVTNYDISPTTAAWVKPTVTFLGLTSIAIFALGAFAFNADIIDKLSANANNPDDNLDWLYDLSLPLASSLLATQLFHELGHIIVAAKDGINIGIPTLVPGFQFGLTGGITPIKSSPRDLKSLFDFAIAGPIFGLVASMILLYTGLAMTAFMDSSALEQLPTVPVEILRSSALGGGLIDYLLGDGVLNSPDETQLIKLHPYAISGFSGLVLNALSLLPIGNTDGGRICITFFGRSFSRVVQGTTILLLVLAGFFGADKANTLLCYAIFTQCFQNEAEIPCRNEVDELDSFRGIVAIGMSLIVVLTLMPLP